MPAYNTKSYTKRDEVTCSPTITVEDKEQVNREPYIDEPQITPNIILIEGQPFKAYMTRIGTTGSVVDLVLQFPNGEERIVNEAVNRPISSESCATPQLLPIENGGIKVVWINKAQTALYCTLFKTFCSQMVCRWMQIMSQK